MCNRNYISVGLILLCLGFYVQEVKAQVSKQDCMALVAYNSLEYGDRLTQATCSLSVDGISTQYSFPRLLCNGYLMLHFRYCSVHG